MPDIIVPVLVPVPVPPVTALQQLICDLAVDADIQCASAHFVSQCHPELLQQPPRIRAKGGPRLVQLAHRLGSRPLCAVLLRRSSPPNAVLASPRHRLAVVDAAIRCTDASSTSRLARSGCKSTCNYTVALVSILGSCCATGLHCRGVSSQVQCPSRRPRPRLHGGTQCSAPAMICLHI
ncbi:hypothetical protein M431DRAFT_439333 [Trichoderma harzianum CBS 226.95]|uniref:Uncharacterized protein n=1 Tax=Trichoderma harzianum CBS 226.95 TaxID=983964 RepID=A0A2T4ADW7_TRIHA|nr:hypothetical protein M431DRAFT_439333 [Trichoderma harzianum CBS 226.95]PTB55222.1 hypothetical protein M431DRAFT_439333 [Trichoderma harzianum CBS 226.95]